MRGDLEPQEGLEEEGQQWGAGRCERSGGVSVWVCVLSTPPLTCTQLESALYCPGRMETKPHPPLLCLRADGVLVASCLWVPPRSPGPRTTLEV